MYKERDEINEKEWRDFRSMLFAMHPSEGQSILEAIDAAREDAELATHGLSEFAAELPEEELEGYVPFSAEEVEDTIALLRRFGVKVEE